MEPGRGEFGKGVALGVAAALTLVTAMLAYDLRTMAGIYSDIGDITLPLLTRLTIANAWLIGAPLAGAAACAGLFVARPRSLAPYVAVAIGMTVIALLTWFCPRLPIMELAGNIKP